MLISCRFFVLNPCLSPVYSLLVFCLSPVSALSILCLFPVYPLPAYLLAVYFLLILCLSLSYSLPTHCLCPSYPLPISAKTYISKSTRKPHTARVCPLPHLLIRHFIYSSTPCFYPFTNSLPQSIHPLLDSTHSPISRLSPFTHFLPQPSSNCRFGEGCHDVITAVGAGVGAGGLSRHTQGIDRKSM